MDRLVLPNVYPLGGVADFPFEVFGSDGKPATTVVLGTTTLKSRDPDTGVVTIQSIPGQGVSYIDEGSRKYRAVVDLADPVLIAAGFFANGKEIRGKIELTIDGVAGFDFNFADSFTIGERIVVPGDFADFGDFRVRVRVVDDDGNGVPNAVVTFRNGGRRRWVVTVDSEVPSEVGYATLTLSEGVWVASSYGSGVSTGSGVLTIEPIPDEEDPLFELLIEVVRDSIPIPDTPDLTTGYFTALELGIPVSGKRFVCRLIRGPNGAYASDTQPVVKTSQIAPLGQVAFTHLQPGARYGVRPYDGREPEKVFTATGVPGGSFEIQGIEYHA